MESDRTLDCVGLYCPMPIVNTAKEIKEMAEGEVLEVIADDEGIRSDMPAWCEKTGNEFIGLEEADGEIKVYIKKNLEPGT